MKTFLIAIGIIGAMFVATFMSLTSTKVPQPTIALGSIGNGGYLSTTTDSFGTGAAYKEQLLKKSSGIFGSVVVSLTSNANLYVCNATTTGAQMGTTFSTTTQCIASFKTTPAGTYTYDVAFNKGLMVISNTTVGMASSTVTWF